MEEQRRREEFEKQLEDKGKLDQDEAQRLKFISEERRKTQEAKEEGALLAVLVLEKVQNEVNDPEALSNRLLYFKDNPLKFVPSSNPHEPLPVIPLPLPGLLQATGANHGTALPPDNPKKVVTPSPPLLQQPKSAV